MMMCSGRMINDCRELLLPLINEAFGEHYTGDEKIVFSVNEHFLNRENGNEDKRITDTSFLVEGPSGSKRYHWECQATADHSLLLRLFEYDAQIALDQDREMDGNTLIVSFPNTVVLYLRSSSTTKNHMTVQIVTPGGDVSYMVPVIKMQSYSLHQIFEKTLLLLIPFYIFNREQDIPVCDENDEKRKQLVEEFQYIREELERRCQKNLITEYQKRAIIEMTAKVIENLASQYRKVNREVGGIMVGKVLDYEAKRLLNEGISQGKEQGIKLKLVSMVCKKLVKGKTPQEIAEDLEEDLSEIQKICTVASGFAPEYQPEAVLAAIEKEEQESLGKG